MPRVPERVGRRYTEITAFADRGLSAPAGDDQLLALLAEALRADAIALLHTDPDTFLAVEGRMRGYAESAAAAFFRGIYLQRERVSYLDMRARGLTVSVLSKYTGGRPEMEPRYLEVYRPHRLEHELRACLAAGRGYWGALCITRGDDAPDFDRWDRWLLERLSPRLAAALRRERLRRSARIVGEGDSGRSSTGKDDRLGPANAAVIVVDPVGGSVLFQTSAAPAVFEDLFGRESPATGPLPLALQSLVAAAMGAARGSAAADPVRDLTLRGRSGRWWTASLLGAAGAGEAGEAFGPRALAVVLTPARAPDALRAIARAYDLTEREEQVLGLVSRGLTTGEIAARLWVTPYTVQDHLKSVFEKIGVRSRRELMACVFHLDSPLGRLFAPPGTSGL